MDKSSDASPDKKRNLKLAVGIGLLVIGVGTIIWQLWANNRDTRGRVPNDFFSTDDGQTWFVASSNNLPPFDHDGKQAVKAWVYECNGKRFVGYLERFNAEAHKVMTGGASAAAPAPAAPVKNSKLSPEAQARNRVSLSPGAVMNASMNGKEYKRPGDKEWTKSTDRRKVAELMAVKCPDGKSPATPVSP
jgi:hypothetical protein